SICSRTDTKEKFEQYWKPIQDLGGSFESKVDDERVLYAVDIPPEADIGSIIDKWKSGKNMGYGTLKKRISDGDRRAFSAVGRQMVAARAESLAFRTAFDTPWLGSEAVL